MDLNRLTRDADDLIRKVVSRYNQLYIPAGNISQLELDLMLDDLRKLYDTFKHIGHINLTLQDSISKTEVKVNTVVPTEPQPVASATPSNSEEQFISPEPAQVPSQPDAEPFVEPEPQYETEIKKEPDSELALPDKTEEELIPEPETETEPVFNNEFSIVSEISEIENIVSDNAENSNPVNIEPAPAMLADKFNTGNKSLSETIASTHVQGGIGSRLQFQPIADLNTGIGLNDKFSFISDLFGNNSTQYDEAIQRINKAVNLDEANWILQKYHSSEWEQKHESLARLKDFVKRRFI